MGDWCAGFSDSDDDYLDDFTADDIVEDNKPAARKPARILTCPHCHSYNLRMRDSTRESTVVRFQCKNCGKTSPHDCPNSYERVYRAIE